MSVILDYCSFPFQLLKVNKKENGKRVDEKSLAAQSFRTAVLCLSIFNASFNELLLFTETEYYAMQNKSREWGECSKQNIMTDFQ